MNDTGIRHRLFVAERPAWPLAIVRILIGLTIIAWALTLLVDLDTFVGADAVIPSELADSTLRWLPHDSTTIMLLAIVALIASATAVTVGFRPTVFLVISFLLLVAIQRRSPQLLNSGDVILRNLTLLLAFCPTGAALSLDRVRRFGRDALFTSARVAPWGLRLVQLQMVTVYLFAFWSKSGDSWRDGTAVSTALRLVDLQRFGQIDVLVESVPVVAALTWGTLVVELALATLLWVKRFRPALIVLGIGLHVSIDSLLQVGFFGPAMIAGLMVFLDADAVEARVRQWAISRGLTEVDVSGGREIESDLGAAGR